MHYWYIFYRPNDLLHFGVPGMKWGIRRFQPYPSGSKKGKEIGEAAKAGLRSRVSADVTKKVSKQMAKQEKRDQKYRDQQIANARKQKQEQEKLLKEKAEAYKRGDAKVMEKFLTEMTTQEINDFTNRMKAIENLKMQSAKQADANYKKVKSALDKVGDFGDFSQKFAKYFTSASEIKKALDSFQKTEKSSGGGKK